MLKLLLLANIKLGNALPLVVVRANDGFTRYKQIGVVWISSIDASLRRA